MPKDLPRWPITLLGFLFPVLWFLGFSFLFIPLIGFCATIVLIRRRHALLPPAWYLWFGYLVLVAASVVQIDSTGRLIGYAMRVFMVVGATMIAVYVYSATPRSLPTTYVFAMLSLLWVFVVFGGWLGVLLPEVTLQTPASLVMPNFLMSNELVDALVRPRFAEIQQPYGVAEPFIRPAAPFQGANGWGCNIAFLAPIVYRYIQTISGWRRVTLIAISLSALVPAAATLNRGLIIGLVLAIVYVAVRSILSGNIRVAGVAAGVILVGGFAANALGIVATLSSRLEASGTNDTRGALYDEAIQRTLESPILGYGAPRPSLLLDVSVGTQGHIWNIMVSHGFLALAFYVSFFLCMAWFGAKARPIADGAHVTVIVGVVLMWFYGLDGPQLAVLLIAAALSVRDARMVGRPFLEREAPLKATEKPAIGAKLSPLALERIG